MSSPLSNQKTQPIARHVGSAPLPNFIGPYKIEALLDTGHISHLYLALDPKTHKPVVVKVLADSLRQNKAMLERFLKEAKIITMVSHPNVVELIDQGSWEGGIYIAMEFIHGISLKKPILQNTFSEKKALQIALQVGYALCHLHAHGIIHRDLKPENILLTNSGDVKVIDFGIAMLFDSTLAPSRITFMGTPDYMSPEQKKNPHNVSFNTDIYALGVVTYELLIGRLSCGILQYELLPKHLRAAIKKATDPDPAKRTQDIVDFIAEIVQYLEKEGFRPTSFSQAMGDLSEKFQIAQDLLSNTKGLPSALKIERSHSKGPSASRPIIEVKRLQDGRTALLFLGSATSHIDSALYSAFGLGALRSKLDRSVSAPDLILELDTLFKQLKAPKVVSLAALFLSPSLDHVTFATFGYASLWYKPSGSLPTCISHAHPFIGALSEEDISFSAQNFWDEDHLIVSLFPGDQNALFTAAKNAALDLETTTSLITKTWQESIEKNTSSQTDFSIFTIGKN